MERGARSSAAISAGTSSISPAKMTASSTSELLGERPSDSRVRHVVVARAGVDELRGAGDDELELAVLAARDRQGADRVGLAFPWRDLPDDSDQRNAHGEAEPLARV